MIMLPSNTAASAADSDSRAVNGGECDAVNGTWSELNGAAESCYTPVTDPDSMALLAAMHEANRFTAPLFYVMCRSSKIDCCYSCVLYFA